MDGCYGHSSGREANKKIDGVEGYLKVNENLDKHCIIVMHNCLYYSEILANPQLLGAKITYTFVALSKNYKTVSDLTKPYIEHNSTIHTEERPSYDNLRIDFDCKYVNHS
ncbi:transposase [Bartonella phoceensis]|uniref:transposase n=1 Tax=Bartonella phoceensis TaxID=270249 RepID=UPI003CCD3335